MKLYELTQTYEEVLQELEEHVDSNGVIDDEFVEKLDNIKDKFDNKVGNCCKAIKMLEGNVETVGKERERLERKSKGLQRQIEFLKGYIQNNMERLRIDMVETALFKVRLQKSPITVNVDEIDKVDSKWIREIHEVKIDKRALIDHIKATGEVPSGVDMIESNHLRIY